MNWGNATGTLRWNHIFDEKLFSNFTFVVNQFDYNIGFNDDGPQSFLWQSSLTDYNLKANFTWFANTNNKVFSDFQACFMIFSQEPLKAKAKNRL